jgi:hypothetical protein
MRFLLKQPISLIKNAKIEYHQISYLCIKTSTINRQHIQPLLKIKLCDYKKKVYYKNYSSNNSSSLNKINSSQLAREFVSTLTFDERRLIKEELIEIEKIDAANQTPTSKVIPRPFFSQLFLGNIKYNH